MGCGASKVPPQTCRNCSSNIPAGSQFCPNCGTKVTPPKPPSIGSGFEQSRQTGTAPAGSGDGVSPTLLPTTSKKVSLTPTPTETEPCQPEPVNPTSENPPPVQCEPTPEPEPAPESTLAPPPAPEADSSLKRQLSSTSEFSDNGVTTVPSTPRALTGDAVAEAPKVPTPRITVVPVPEIPGADATPATAPAPEPESAPASPVAEPRASFRAPSRARGLLTRGVKKVAPCRRATGFTPFWKKVKKDPDGDEMREAARESRHASRNAKFRLDPTAAARGIDLDDPFVDAIKDHALARLNKAFSVDPEENGPRTIRQDSCPFGKDKYTVVSLRRPDQTERARRGRDGRPPARFPVRPTGVTIAGRRRRTSHEKGKNPFAAKCGLSPPGFTRGLSTPEQPSSRRPTMAQSKTWAPTSGPGVLQSKPRASRAFTREELMEQYLTGVGKGPNSPPVSPISRPDTSRLSTIQSKPRASRALTREELMEQYLTGVGKGPKSPPVSPRSRPETSRLSTIQSKPRASRVLTPEDLYKQYLGGTGKEPSCQPIPEIVITPSMDVTRRSSSASAATSSDSSSSSTSSRNSTVTRKPTLPTKPTFDWGSPALTPKEKKKALRKKKGKKRRRIGKKSKPNYLRGTTTSKGRKRKSRGARAITLGSQLRFQG